MLARRGPLDSGADLRLSLAVPPWSRSEAPPKDATLTAFGQAGTAVPLGFCALGMTLGAYLGGCEGKPMMNAALREREIEGVHAHMSDRAPQEDAMVSFIKAGREGWENGGNRVGK